MMGTHQFPYGHLDSYVECSLIVLFYSGYDMIRSVCPTCNSPTLHAFGSPQSQLLIVGDAPDKASLSEGRLFASNSNFMTAGKVLRQETARVGLDIYQFRVTSLWTHAPNKSGECFKVGYENVLDEAKGKSAILLVGSEVVETFTPFKVSDVTGLQVDSPLLSCPIIYAMVNPSIVFAKSYGEVRFAIEQFNKRLKEEGLI